MRAEKRFCIIAIFTCGNIEPWSEETANIELRGGVKDLDEVAVLGREVGAIRSFGVSQATW